MRLSQMRMWQIFRKRFFKFLIILGLIYIRAGIAMDSHTITPTPIQQPLSVVNASDSPRALTNNTSSVLAQKTIKPTMVETPPYVPACSYRTVPYKTVYKTASWMDIGQSISTGGIDGQEKVCTNQSGPPTISTIISPLDKTVTTGTYVPPTYNYTYPDPDDNHVPGSDDIKGQ